MRSQEESQTTRINTCSTIDHNIVLILKATERHGCCDRNDVISLDLFFNLLLINLFLINQGLINPIAYIVIRYTSVASKLHAEVSRSIVKII